MFGYVLPPLADLRQEDQERFRRMYCGLCHTLAQRCGAVARYILNYDFVFLAILLSAPDEPEFAIGRCPINPVKSRDYFAENTALELAADESVILTYWQLQDQVTDRGVLQGSKYRLLARLLRPAYQRAAAALPSFDASTREQLRVLSELERESCCSIDRAADAFACLLRDAAQEIGDPVRRRVLEQMLYHMGRWIYLIDAADDLKEDTRSGNYNPVALRYQLPDGIWTPESRKEFAQTLDHSIRMIATAFELYDFGCWSPLLERTIYSSFFQVGKAVLEGEFHTSRTHKRKTRNLHERPL